jgi:hypothetical protein
MENLSSKQVFKFPWCVSFLLLFPVFLAIHVTSSSIHIDNRHIDDNGDLPGMYNLENGINIGGVNDVTGDSRRDTFTANTAAGNFLESLRRKCKRLKSITLICNSLRLVLPIVLPNQPISASEETNTESTVQNMKLENRMTQTSDVTDTETYIARPDTYEATTDVPINTHYFHIQNHKINSVTTNRDNAYEMTDPNGQYTTDHMLSNVDNTYMRPDMFHKAAYQNHMLTDNFETNGFRKNDNSDVYSHVTEDKYGSNEPDVAHNVTYEIQFAHENVFSKSDRSEQNAYPEIMESDAQDINNVRKRDKSSNIAYQTHVMTSDSEEVFRETDRSEQNDYPEIMESDVQDRNNARKSDKLSNNAYQTHIMTGDSEDVFREMDRSHAVKSDSEEGAFRKMDRSAQTAYSEHTEATRFTTPKTDINPDYDEMKDREKNIRYEMEDEEIKNYLHQDEDERVCSDEETCPVAENRAENASDKAGGEGEGEGGEPDNTTMDRFIDDSVKIFKNSFTIKFPTFERITNKISEWFQFVFGTKTRDEGKITLKLN